MELEVKLVEISTNKQKPANRLKTQYDFTKSLNNVHLFSSVDLGTFRSVDPRETGYNRKYIFNQTNRIKIRS